MGGWRTGSGGVVPGGGSGGGQSKKDGDQEQKQVQDSGREQGAGEGGEIQNSYHEERNLEKPGKSDENLLLGWVPFPEVKSFKGAL